MPGAWVLKPQVGETPHDTPCPLQLLRVSKFKSGNPLLAWSFFTGQIEGCQSAPDEPGGDTWPDDSHTQGGTSIWITGTYGPATNLAYRGTGNPVPQGGAVMVFKLEK